MMTRHLPVWILVQQSHEGSVGMATTTTFITFTAWPTYVRFAFVIARMVSSCPHEWFRHVRMNAFVMSVVLVASTSLPGSLLACLPASSLACLPVSLQACLRPYTRGIGGICTRGHESVISNIGALMKKLTSVQRPASRKPNDVVQYGNSCDDL